MPKKGSKAKTRPSGDEWFVYLVRCADGSLYTGIAKDLERRCRQHNAGTASRYTRSRTPVELVYQERQPDHGSALRRERAIKAMIRREKTAMVRPKKRSATERRTVARLEDIPNVGPAVAAAFRRMGITLSAELPGRDPFALYDDLCQVAGRRHDPCLLDTFLAAVRYMEGGPKRPWRAYTSERKRVLAIRQEAGG